jgi:hypothetical protein
MLHVDILLDVPFGGARTRAFAESLEKRASRNPRNCMINIAN